MAAIPKPNVRVTQQIEANAVTSTSQLPTLLVGPRYDLVEYPEDKDKGLLGNYSGSNPSDAVFDYPNKEASSVVDIDSTKLFMEQGNLKYYSFGSDVWRKLGSYPNRLRTILSTGLIFKDDSSGSFPHSGVFGTRDVTVGDTVYATVGSKNIKTKVTGFIADKSIASIQPVSANAGNKQDVTGSVGTATAGVSNSTNTTMASSGTYSGSLQTNVLEDTYTVRVISTGTSPTSSVVQQSGATLLVSTNSYYDFPVSEIYTIEIMSGGALGTATYRVISTSGTDNVATTTTPLLNVFTNLGTRGAQFKFTGSGSLTLGDTYVVTITPSSARLQITTASGSDQVSSRVFPGYGTAFSVGSRGVLLTATVSSSLFLSVGDYWTILAKKAIVAVVANEGGTFTGPIDINYIIEVVQGGAFGVCAIKVSSTYNDSQPLLPVTGFGSSNTVNVGSYGVTVYFNNNTQGGLILGDKFSIKTIAAKDTAFKTLVVQDSLPTEGDVTTTSSAVYSGSGGSPNTGTSSGTYVPSNSALDLYNTEVYTISISTGGAYGTAQFLVSSSSGLDNVTTPVTIPLTPATAIAVGTKGVFIAFSGANPFTTNDQWQITVSKPNLQIKLAIPVVTREIAKKREDIPTQDAWSADASEIVVDSGLELLESSWSNIDTLPIEDGLLYLEYRALHILDAEKIISISELSQIEPNLGPINPKNVVAYAASISTLPVNVIYPASDNLSGYNRIFSKLEVRNNSEVYRIAYLGFDVSVMDALKVHILKMSTPEKSKWRRAFICRELPAKMDIVGTPENSPVTGTIEEDILNPGEFTILKTTNGNFSTCAPGDIIVYLGQEFVVKTVPTPTEIVMEESFGSAQSVPASVYIYRIPSITDEKNLLIFYGQFYNDQRVMHIVPDKYIRNGEELPGYFQTAILASLKGSYLPHQGLTNSEVSNIDEVPKTLYGFSETEMDEIAGGGNCILAQDNVNTPVYVRHQLTTDVSSVQTRELSFVENLDDLSYGLLNIIKPFIGKANIHSGVLAQLRTNIQGYLYSKTSITNDFVGPQIISANITKLEAAANQPDKILLEVRAELTKPFNYADLLIIAS